MAPSVFDASYGCLVVNYLMDGVLTAAALGFGLASEGNPLMQGVKPSAVLLAKALALVAVTVGAYFVWRLEPRSEEGIRLIWRSGAGVFGLVSLWNFGLIAGWLTV